MKCPVQVRAFAGLTTTTDFRAQIPRGATHFRVQGFPDAAASVPSTLPHYRARMRQSLDSAPPAGATVGQSDVLAEFDFLEHPALWDSWIPLAEEDATGHRAILVHNGGNVGCTGVINQGRVMFRFDGDK